MAFTSDVFTDLAVNIDTVIDQSYNDETTIVGSVGESAICFLH